MIHFKARKDGKTVAILGSSILSIWEDEDGCSVFVGEKGVAVADSYKEASHKWQKYLDGVK